MVERKRAICLNGLSFCKRSGLSMNRCAEKMLRCNKTCLTFIVRCTYCVIESSPTGSRLRSATRSQQQKELIRHDRCDPDIRRFPEVLQGAARGLHRRIGHAVEGPAGHRRRIRPTIRRRPSPPARRCGRSFWARAASSSAIQIQTEFAKQAYEGFVAQATKVSELYTRVASDALKPVSSAYASLQK